MRAGRFTTWLKLLLLIVFLVVAVYYFRFTDAAERSRLNTC